MSKSNIINNNPSKILIRFIFIGSLISFISGILLSFIISNTCKYHEPINEEPGILFNMFLDIISGHPEANGLYWLLILLFGLVLAIFIKKGLVIS